MVKERCENRKKQKKL